MKSLYRLKFKYSSFLFYFKEFFTYILNSYLFFKKQWILEGAFFELIYIYIYVCVRVCVCVCVCVYFMMNKSVEFSYIYIAMHGHTHTHIHTDLWSQLKRNVQLERSTFVNVHDLVDPMFTWEKKTYFYRAFFSFLQVFGNQLHKCYRKMICQKAEKG